MPIVAATAARMRRRESMLALSSVALAMAPKCPLCFLAIAGAVGAAAAPWVAPLTIGCLALTVATVARHARLLAIAAAIEILIGRFDNNHLLVFAGCAALLVAALWRTRKSCDKGECR